MEDPVRTPLVEMCEFRKEHAEDLSPVGPACGREATQIIHWADGRWSPACDAHGFSVLDDLAKRMVARIEVIGRTESRVP
jgi:hypothetical protein